MSAGSPGYRRSCACLPNNSSRVQRHPCVNAGRPKSFPRVTARIDGEDIQFLLDTGARTELTDSAWRIVGSNEPRHRATSFITTQRFEQWHKKHPEWLVVPNAEKPSGSAMMRVPTIEVGGRQISPVWFTERPDRNFKDFMSQYMDRPIEGALGGSAWRYVTLVLDYPGPRRLFSPLRGAAMNLRP